MKFFLEQCLFSVKKAAAAIPVQIIVIDNNSTDGSEEYLKTAFPDILLVANKENMGFGKACNQGLAMAAGKYILFLNPDTIVPEDCFEKCIAFLENHEAAGALGVRMLDGKGNFLKESKRAFPSPLTSLFKLFGLARLFPKSKLFARYHLGHLAEHKNHEVDVLAGAFIFTSKKVLDKVGGFDEMFFMYGEDIDLSYRIQKAGYQNYYFADSTIIHFKGESTKKGGLNYVRIFYQAMSLFVQKHYSGNRARIFNMSIHAAIWVRAGISAIGRFIRKIGMPLIDTAIILLSFWVVHIAWSRYISSAIPHTHDLLWKLSLSFTLVYIIALYYAGLYDRWYKTGRVWRGAALTSVGLLLLYLLLPAESGFLGTILLVGALFAFIIIIILRWFFKELGVLPNQKEETLIAGTIVAGSLPEYEEVCKLYAQSAIEERILGRVATNTETVGAIAHINQLASWAVATPFHEIVFCEGSQSYKTIMAQLSALPAAINVKYFAANSKSIVGSNSKDNWGEAVSADNRFQLADPYYRRVKRVIDVVFSLIGILLFPLSLMTIKKPQGFLRNCVQVLVGKKTWIGYATYSNTYPFLRKSVLAPNGASISAIKHLPKEPLLRLDFWYAKEYKPLDDLMLLAKKYRQLGA